MDESRAGSGEGVRPSIAHDKSGQEPWKSVVTRHWADGSISEEIVVNRDGSLIHSRFSASSATTGWDERHTIAGADGTILMFQNHGLTQRILDDEARLLSESVWTEHGPRQRTNVHEAFAAPLLEATVELAVTLFTWLSTRNSADRQAVIGFSARQYLPNARTSLGLDYVGLLERDKVDAACPKLGEVQARTNEAVDTVKRHGAIDLTPAAFGTAVHFALKADINSLDDPNFRADVSVLKSLDETYGTKDSVRVDVYENVGDGTVCVYDIKTGKRGLGPARAAEIAVKVFASYGKAKRIIIIETRPTR